ncbi:deoxyuridine 5'-triphosphate nucleotidohydrolase-like [Ischnura elegans]|uniref:deoxyuridine 5'-triphosphate nucleotidohydrolase-like n=1 Tax=Ischnura elegans TaxID=197161 RepID=UPI001ED8A89E|nr:deoxyuridine 5'-triphosphate nucleotidohydrolase-like [Ischnura elegans]
MAGYDITAIKSDIIRKRGRALLRTGFSLEILKGLYGRLASRSGSSVKYGIEVGAGVIDPDYSGEIKVLLYNHGDDDFAVNRGDRICQLILEKIATDVTFVVIHDNVSQTSRGEGGFGSSNHPPFC